MPNTEAAATLREVLAIVGARDWRTDKNTVRQSLARFLTDDILEGEYEFINVPAELRVLKEIDTAPDQVEFIVRGFSLSDKATLIRGPDGRWRVKSFVGQCTGCLGSGKILDRGCNSCSGTGWGLRPSSEFGGIRE